MILFTSEAIIKVSCSKNIYKVLYTENWEINCGVVGKTKQIRELTKKQKIDRKWYNNVKIQFYKNMKYWGGGVVIFLVH